mgnify:CR=1 FL=1
MDELTWQKDTPCQADDFSLLKLLKRPKNTKVTAILRYDISMLKYSKIEL